MKNKTLFSTQSHTKLKAYMSSALTGFPSNSPKEEDDKREEVMKLNLEIQDLCKKLDVDLYLPQQSSNPKSNHDDGLSPDEVYLLDRWRIAESDFVIINADNLSFGVGQEMEIATSTGTPCLVFYQEGKSVSRMLKGSPSIFVLDGDKKDESYIVYSDMDNLFTKLSDRIRSVSATINFESSNNAKVENFGKLLKDARESKDFSINDLSKRSGFSISFLTLLETEIEYFTSLAENKNLNNADFIDASEKSKFSNPGLYVLDRLSEALEIPIIRLIPQIPKLQNFDTVDIYREALKVVNPSMEQLIKINEAFHFDFYQKQAAFNGNQSLTKGDLVIQMREVING